MRRSHIILSFIFLLGITLLASAQSDITIPHRFSGVIEYPDNPDFPLEGIEISALFNGNPTGVVGVVGEDGRYLARIETQGQGGEVIFSIGGVEATPSINEEEYQMGATTELDLEIDEEPQIGLCGNDVIDFGEECDGNNFGVYRNGVDQCRNYNDRYESGDLICSGSCRISTQQCVLAEEDDDNDDDNNNNNNGGGGGGGSGSSKNSRTINKDNSNKTNDNEQQFLSNNNNNEENNPIELNRPQDDIERFGGITGAVIGIAQSVRTFVVFIFITAILVASILVRRLRKKRFPNAFKKKK